MCGLIGSDASPGDVAGALHWIAHRGPDSRAFVNRGRWTLGHTRLAVIDVSPASNQPFLRGDDTLTYNGELWNYRELRARLAALGVSFTTTGDTEVVAAALATWGTDALEQMDGMWALAWEHDGRVLLARDRFGEIPLHVGRRADRSTWWASELKALAAVGCSTAADLPPGAYSYLDRFTDWYRPVQGPLDDDLDQAASQVRHLFGQGCRSRAAAADVPVCTLLSGGIDSAMTAYHLAQTHPDLVAYTAVLDPTSRDLHCARITADALGIDLVEVVIDPPTADDLARVVYEIEQPHKAQVEIGWACLALADAMRADGFIVTFSGEGSDELWASYGMSYHGIKQHGWDTYRRRLVYDQARKNFARCNKVFMARGVEVRLPFLHRPLVEYALNLPQTSVRDGSRPKAVLERGYASVLPREVIRRPKLAFQDGAGIKTAAAAAVAHPARFYRAEFRRQFPLAA